MGAYCSYTCTVGPAECFWEIVEHAVHIHQHFAIAYFTNAGPLSVPPTTMIVSVRSFWQAVGVPLAAIEQFQNHRAFIPSNTPQRGFIIGSTIYATRTCNIGKLF